MYLFKYWIFKSGNPDNRYPVYNFFFKKNALETLNLMAMAIAIEIILPQDSIPQNLSSVIPTHRTSS